MHFSTGHQYRLTVYNLPLTQLLLIQNHFQTLVNIPAHLTKAVFLIESLGWNLEDGGVEMQRLIAKSAGTGFELIQNDLAIAASRSFHRQTTAL